LRRILVAGVGDVGAALARRRVAAGDEVHGLRRDVSRLPAGIVPVRADLTRPETLRQLPQGLDALVYAAAADRADERAYRAVYVDGLRNVLDAVGPVARVLFVSTTGVYGQRDGEWVDERSATEPTRFTGRVMLEGETLARSRAGAVVTVLRLGGIYGPGRGRLVEQVRRGEATCVPGVVTNRVHRDDAVAAIAHVLESARPPAVVNVVDDDPAERCAVLRWLADRLGAPAPAVVSGDARTRTDNKRVSNALLRSFGWVPRFPTFREGYAAVLRAGTPDTQQ
jgi:nucleoside-diphosphate-sugar epimerase